MKRTKIILLATLILGFAGCNNGTVTGNAEQSADEQIQAAYDNAINGNASYMTVVDFKQAKHEIKAEGFKVSNTGIAKKASLEAKKGNCTMKVNKVGTNWAQLDEQCQMMGTATTWTYFMKKDNGVWKAPITE